MVTTVFNHFKINLLFIVDVVYSNDHVFLSLWLQ